MDKSTNSFCLGDVVLHRASGEKGIIVHIYEGECQNAEHFYLFDCVKNPEKCQSKFIDYYDISVSFEKTIEKIDGMLLEKEALFNG